MTAPTSSDPVTTLEFVHDENPFKAIRLHMGLTQVQVAQRAHLTKHAVIRNEQAMAAEPLPRLLNYFADVFPVSVYSLRAQYERFQIAQRVKAGKLLGDLIQQLSVWGTLPHNTRKHPLEFLRIMAHPQLNPTSLSKELCLNQSVISHFENSPTHQHTVPEQLLVALKQAGYNDTELKWLERCYTEYRQIVLGTRRMLLDTNGLEGANSVD